MLGLFEELLQRPAHLSLVPLALQITDRLDPLVAGMVIALSCSLAMALPVSTPPNAVAYASGAVKTSDLARVGLVVGGVGVVLVVFVAPPLWKALGLL